MISKALKLCSQVAVALTIAAAPASAVSIGPGPTPNIIGAGSTTYVLDPSVNPSAGTFTNFFNFMTTVNTRFLLNSVTVNIPGGSSSVGITGLTMSVWSGLNGTSTQIGSDIAITNSLGSYTPLFNPNGVLSPAILLASLVPSDDFSVRLTGFRLANGGSYSAVFDASTPLPPALLLFGTALAGMGFLGRRRRKSEA